MADPTTELAKEFLEFNNYLVRKETKFYRNKELKGTASDIDIMRVHRSNMMTKETREEVKEQETWTCPICVEENPSDEDVCQACGSLREEPSYDAITDEKDIEDV